MNFRSFDFNIDWPVLPVTFWKYQSAKLPGLSTVVCSIFAIPACQNKTERSLFTQCR